MLDFLNGITGLLGGLFGSSSTQTIDMTEDTETQAESQDLAPDLLKALEGLFLGQVGGQGGGGFGAATAAVGDRLQQLTDQSKAPMFDVDAFVKGITDQAISSAGLVQESGLNQATGNIGGTAKGNSMNALLSNKIRNATAANIAGVSSQAKATGEGIRQAQQGQITEGISGLSSALAQQILGLVAATRGASNTGKSKTHSERKGTIETSGGGLFG